MTLMQYILRHRGKIALGVLMVTVTVGVNLGIPFLVRFAVDDLDGGVMTTHKLWIYVVSIFAATSLGGVFFFWMRRIPLSISHQVEYEIRNDVFTRLTQLEQDFYRRERTGDIMTRMASDLHHVRDFIGQGLLQGFRTTLVLVLAFSIMFAISWPLALMIAILMPSMTLIFFGLLRVLRKRHEAVQEQFSEISNYAQESFSGVRTIKGFAIEGRRRQGFRALNEEFIKRNLSLALAEQPLWPVMAFLFGCGIVLLLVVGGRFVIQDKLSLGELVQFIHYLYYMQWPMLATGWLATLLQRGLASWKRVNSILTTEPSIADGPWTDHTIASVRGDIEIRHVSVDLGGQRVLDDISLNIPEGCTLGITGPTGSGKSTLASLLVRLLEPTEGQVFIGVHDIRAYPLDLIRREIGMAPQEPFLFSETLRHNIAFGLHAMNDDTVRWAADIAELSADVELFPEKYETVLGERGVTLSGGQRQRTAIGRAVARNPHILILDDVLSAVDTQTEAGILSRLRPVMKERTSVLISHRASTLRTADFIIVLENGRITAMGSHDELTKQEGYYKDIHEVQQLEAQLEAS